jgi:predicted hotdog family 3-hydroxylacyl-ACP dehydratase
MQWEIFSILFLSGWTKRRRQNQPEGILSISRIEQTVPTRNPGLGGGFQNNFNRIDLESLLPHRSPMLLISQILSFDDQKAVTRAVVSGHWPMSGTKGVDAVVLIELVAQTAGVNNGWALSQQEGPEVDHRGWIVGIKHARLFVATIQLGTVIETSSENIFAYEYLREIRGTARIGSQVAAEVTLQLMQADNGGLQVP